jgi:hypothetical protein
MTVQVDAQPTLTIGAVTCAPDLLTYSVSFTATGGTVSATAGTISGSMVTGIPAGTDVAITVSNGTNTACDVSQNVTAPDCNCPPIAAPTINPATATICAGAPIPAFTASVPAGLTVIWYDAATGGTVLLANNLSFTPTQRALILPRHLMRLPAAAAPPAHRRPDDQSDPDAHLHAGAADLCRRQFQPSGNVR